MCEANLNQAFYDGLADLNFRTKEIQLLNLDDEVSNEVFDN